MKFWEAMKALEVGEKVRACHWEEKHYLYMGTKKQGLISAWCGIPPLTQCFDWEWEFYEEPVFSFREMIDQLKIGKRFKRKHWIINFVHLDCRVFKAAGPLTIEDFESNDWVEVKDG